MCVIWWSGFLGSTFPLERFRSAGNILHSGLPRIGLVFALLLLLLLMGHTNFRCRPIASKLFFGQCAIWILASLLVVLVIGG